MFCGLTEQLPNIGRTAVRASRGRSVMVRPPPIPATMAQHSAMPRVRVTSTNTYPHEHEHHKAYNDADNYREDRRIITAHARHWCRTVASTHRQYSTTPEKDHGTL